MSKKSEEKAARKARLSAQSPRLQRTTSNFSVGQVVRSAHDGELYRLLRKCEHDWLAINDDKFGSLVEKDLTAAGPGEGITLPTKAPFPIF